MAKTDPFLEETVWARLGFSWDWEGAKYVSEEVGFWVLFCKNRFNPDPPLIGYLHNLTDISKNCVEQHLYISVAQHNFHR
jgi:hypothetical protein